jgi:hypothetical protein
VSQVSAGTGRDSDTGSLQNSDIEYKVKELCTTTDQVLSGSDRGNLRYLVIRQG